MKNELKTFQSVLSSDYPECFGSLSEEEEEEEQRSIREAFLKITVHFLRRMDQEVLADLLQSGEKTSLSMLGNAAFECLHVLLVVLVFVQGVLLRFVGVNLSPP